MCSKQASPRSARCVGVDATLDSASQSHACPQERVRQSLLQLAATYAVEDKLNHLLGLPAAPGASLVASGLERGRFLYRLRGGAVEPGALVNVYYSAVALAATFASTKPCGPARSARQDHPAHAIERIATFAASVPPPHGVL